MPGKRVGLCAGLCAAVLLVARAAPADGPGPDAAAVKACVLVRTDRGTQTGFVVEGGDVYTALELVQGASELAVVVSAPGADDGEPYDAYYEAVIAYADKGSGLAVLELVQPPPGLGRLKRRDQARPPADGWGLVIPPLKDGVPIRAAAVPAKVADEDGRLVTTVPNGPTAPGAPLVDADGKVAGLLHAAEGDKFLTLSPLPDPAALKKAANRYRQPQPALMAPDDRNAKRLQAKLAGALKQIAGPLAALKFRECVPSLRAEARKDGNKRVAPTLNGWADRLEQAADVWEHLSEQLATRTDLALTLDGAALTAKGVRDGKLVLETTLDLGQLSEDQLRALLAQTTKWKDADPAKREAALANLIEVRSPSGDLYQTLAAGGDPGGALVEVGGRGWPTFLGNPQHNAVFPGTFTGTAEKKWAVDTAFGARVSADLEAVYGMTGNARGKAVLVRLSLATGKTLNQTDVGEVAAFNPPGLAGNFVLVQRANHSRTTLDCYDKFTLKQVWSSPCPEQWERHEHPTPYKDQVFVNGGSYGGWFGFDLKTGKQSWFNGLAQYDGWTPCLYKDVAYAAVGGSLVAADPATGKTLWTAKLDHEWRGWSAAGAVVAADDRLYISASNKGLQCFDLKTQKVLWTQKGGMPPVVGQGLVFVPDGGTLRAYNLKGEQRWTWPGAGAGAGERKFDGRFDGPFPGGGAYIRGTPILYGSTLIVSAGAKTHFLEAGTGKARGEIGEGGDLAVSGNRLLIRSEKGLSCYILK